jgi:hypothetical protein
VGRLHWLSPAIVRHELFAIRSICLAPGIILLILGEIYKLFLRARRRKSA